MRSKLKFLLLFACLYICFSVPLLAQDEALRSAGIPALNPGEGEPPSLVVELAILAGLSILPFAIMLLTSFVKIVVVLSLLRNAIGVQQSPPNQVINGIALLMTVYVMFPTGLAMYNAAGDYVKKSAPENLFSAPTAAFVVNVVDKAKEPLRTFLQKNTMNKHMTSFYQLAYKSFPENFRSSLQPNDFIVLIPAYITSQLKAAFEIGVLIYLPFFVIDLVTSNILLAMGMMMLSPLTIALPLKLLLLVMVDGWTLLIQGLVLSFR
ncbi:MAG: type III secretion system export apparatus subunit SctR [Chlamydiales bacterium]|nr:type III secretion system export apparatus subunit SctR [Chlamydiales bacterium]